MTKDKEKIINSLKDYINYLEENCSQNENYLFRGQSYEDELLPKFYQQNADLKVQSPEREVKMLEDFQRRGEAFFKNRPQSDFEWLALARHYGMPTRLLDWTSNALAALLFAVCDKDKERNTDSAIWILTFKDSDIIKDWQNRSPFKINKTQIFFPPHISDRIRAQGSVLTIHKTKPSPLDKETKFKNKLTKLRIKKGKFPDIRFSLNRCGLNQVTLFPDLVGLCEHIAWKNSKQYPH